MPLLRVIRSIWGRQRRWIQLGGETAAHAEHFGTSIPKGDAPSPLALEMFLAGPTHTCEGNLAEGEALTVYVDDRNLVTRGMQRATEAINMLKGWGDTLGRKENHQKLKV